MQGLLNDNLRVNRIIRRGRTDTLVSLCYHRIRRLLSFKVIQLTINKPRKNSICLHKVNPKAYGMLTHKVNSASGRADMSDTNQPALLRRLVRVITFCQIDFL